MSDQWARSTAQQAAVDLQELIEAHRRADVVVRTYPGDPAQAYADYQADAARMIPAGWYPIAQQFFGGTTDAAHIALFGVLASSLTGPGRLTVTWQYQGHDVSAPPDPPATPGQGEAS
jgi:hypothetical protein